MIDFAPKGTLDVFVRDRDPIIDEGVENALPPVFEITIFDHFLQTPSKPVNEALIDPDNPHILAVGFLVGELVASLQNPVSKHAKAEVCIDDLRGIREHDGIASLGEHGVQHRDFIVEVGVHEDHVVVQQLLGQPQ